MTPSGASVSAGAPAAVPAAPGPWDWPTYGHDAEHTFHGRTTLTKTSVPHPAPSLVLPDRRRGHRHAYGRRQHRLCRVVGRLLLRLEPDDRRAALEGQAQVPGRHHSLPGPEPGDAASDGGLVTSSAWFQPAGRDRPALLIVPGGYTLYALVAATGAVFWEHDYPGLPGPPDPERRQHADSSSPVPADGLVLFGVDEDGQPTSAGSIVAANLQTGDPVWEDQTDVAATGSKVALDDSCGSVAPRAPCYPIWGWWYSGRPIASSRERRPMPTRYWRLRIRNGTLAWRFHPLEERAPLRRRLRGDRQRRGVAVRGDHLHG